MSSPYVSRSSETTTSSAATTIATTTPTLDASFAETPTSSAFQGNFSSRDIVRKEYRPNKTKKLKNIHILHVLTSPHAVALDHFLNHSLIWASIVCVLTIWALYIDDLRFLYFPKEYDYAIALINWIIFAIFMLEWAADSAVHLHYFGSLTSIMDLLAALSLVPMGEVLQDQTSVARIARTFRALRILRATRAAAMALKTEAALKRAHEAQKSAKDLESGGKEQQSKSLLEATLLERGNVKMLLGVLVLLMGMSLIDYTETDRSAITCLSVIDVHVGMMGTETSNNNLTIPQQQLLSDQYRRAVEYNSESVFLYRRLIYLKVYNQVWVTVSKESGHFEKLEQVRRSMEISTVRTMNCVSKIDLKPLFDVQNWNSIISTTFSIVVIMLWVMSFRRDYHVYVLRPVQRMVKILGEMTSNPRLAIAKGKMVKNSENEDDKPKSEMEVIEACIGKFGLLLKVGFGEAGMAIIANNMTGTKVFDPVIPGIKVIAIFGFCDIRNFTDCCEVLEEETMIFTNSIASVVHSRVHSSGGVVNKNIGDAFLTVWKVKRVAPHETSRAHLRRGSMFAALSDGGQHNNQQHHGDAEQNVTLRRDLSKSTRNMFVDMGSQEGTSNGKIESKYATDAGKHPARSANALQDDDEGEQKRVTEERFVHFLSNSYR
jgi:hypothetical protein